MLNELCQLADALEKAKIPTKISGRKLNLLPNPSAKKPCYRISIADDGTITTVDPLPVDLVANLRKWEPSNGSSFPGFNVQPLYRLTDAQQKKYLNAWREGKQTMDSQLLKSWCTKATANWDKKHGKKLFKCVREVPKSLAEFIGNEQNTSMAIIKLIDRAVRFPWAGDLDSADKLYKHSFREQIENYLWSKIEKAEATRDLLAVLIYEGSADKKPEKDRGAISVFLDIPDWDEFPVAHQETIAWLNDQLLQQTTREEINDHYCDAFGNSQTGSADTLPVVKLPFIGKAGLRSMNHESGCQYRYGTIDAKSFPVGRESRDRAQSSLDWLGSRSQEGETWGRADAKELIFAYPVQLPNVSLRLVACFGAQKGTDGEAARFANAAKSVIDGLQAVAEDLNAIEIRVFSLKKMDKARTKVVFHRNYTAQRLIDAAEKWQTGCTNIPSISLRIWSDEKKPILVNPATPYPLQVASCLNRIWKLDGTFIKKGEEKPLIAPTRGIELLLEDNPERFVPHLLSTLLQNSKGLLLYIGNRRLLLDEKGREIVFSVSDKKKYEHHKLLVPSVLGLLLYKLNIRKENYMNQPPFLIGRMLKLADELHALYCKEARDNNLPPQLIGNTLMTAALETPVQALAQLALRLKPYYGWAQTYRGNEKGRLGAYFIGLYGEVAAQLEKQELPSRFNDAERAQFLLGYLAANPKKEANQ